jgi:hypothetical protein
LKIGVGKSRYYILTTSPLCCWFYFIIKLYFVLFAFFSTLQYKCVDRFHMNLNILYTYQLSFNLMMIKYKGDGVFILCLDKQLNYAAIA